MTTNMIPFTEKGNLPAHLKAFAADANEFGGGGAGHPTISLKGKVFTIVRGKEKTLVTKPGTDDEPAASLELVILDVGPKGNLYAKTFYTNGFVEGNSAKPDCYSNDGVAPAADAQERQSTKCALCPQNAVGSGATGQNPKAKACRASKLLAVAPAGQLSDPMLLRVPGASTMKLREYGDYLANRGVKAAAVVTKVGFDYTVAHPALTFKAVGFVTPEMAEEIQTNRETPLVKAIIGEKALATLNDEEDEPFVPVAKQVEAPKPAPKAKPAPAPVAEEDDLPTAPKAKVKVEGDDAPAPAPAPAPAKKAKPAATEVAADEGIEAALDDLDFDD